MKRIYHNATEERKKSKKVQSEYHENLNETANEFLDTAPVSNDYLTCTGVKESTEDDINFKKKLPKLELRVEQSFCKWCDPGFKIR